MSTVGTTGNNEQGDRVQNVTMASETLLLNGEDYETLDSQSLLGNTGADDLLLANIDTDGDVTMASETLLLNGQDYETV